MPDVRLSLGEILEQLTRTTSKG